MGIFLTHSLHPSPTELLVIGTGDIKITWSLLKDQSFLDSQDTFHQVNQNLYFNRVPV